ncbi:MAG: SCO family protein [Balneolaceae bacterium]
MNRISILLVLAGFILFTLGMPRILPAQLNQDKPKILEDVEVREKLGDQIPLDARFATSDGDSVTIGELIEPGKPVLLNPLYYECPLLCGFVLDGVYEVISDLKWTPGVEYTIISFSIDPDEKHPLAAQNKERYLKGFEQKEVENGWHFLTGTKEEIQRMTEAIGFRYTKNEATGEYVHPASIMMLSPEGTVTRYLYGIEFSEFDLRNALYESADGKIGSTVDRAVLYCFAYDPSSQSYAPVAVNIMKLGGLATVIILGIFLGLFWIKERRTSQPQKLEIHQK